MASVLEESKEPDAPERRPFTPAELKKLLKVADGEWPGLIFGGLYLGQRLGDLASLTGRKVDLAEGLVSFRSQETGRDMVIPITEPLLVEPKNSTRRTRTLRSCRRPMRPNATPTGNRAGSRRIFLSSS